MASVENRLHTMAEFAGNLLVAQSGGPTAVVNASVAGVIQQAGRYPEQVEEIYGGLNGILGVLNEDLIDLQEEKRTAIEGLKHTPAAALGTCRYKIDFKKKPELAARDMERLFQVFQAHNIRFFLYVGGNDSQDTAHKIHQQAIARAYQMRVMGVPKTIDNDLPHTDHCPGYGSVIKYNATTVMEIAADVGSMATDDGSCCMAKRRPADAPHLILMPEVPFERDKFLARVQETVSALKYCIVVVGEGLKNAAGEEIAADKTKLDAFGHPVLSGAGERLADMVEESLRLKTRTVKPGYAQRAAAHCASETDVEEAAACGEAAVRAAVDGKSGYMVKLVRLQNNPYKWTVDLQPLGDIANVEHFIPRDWISDDGFLPNEKFIEYAHPLIEGELHLPDEGGLPKFVVLEKVPVQKKLPPRPRATIRFSIWCRSKASS